MIVLQYHREYWADLFMDPIQYFVILNDRDYLLKQAADSMNFHLDDIIFHHQCLYSAI